MWDDTEVTGFTGSLPGEAQLQNLVRPWLTLMQFLSTLPDL